MTDKKLTPATTAAAGRLHDAGITFSICSSRPPFGRRTLVAPLRLALPFGGSNGGSIVNPDLSRRIYHRDGQRHLEIKALAQAVTLSNDEDGFVLPAIDPLHSRRLTEAALPVGFRCRFGQISDRNCCHSRRWRPRTHRLGRCPLARSCPDIAGEAADR